MNGDNEDRRDDRHGDGGQASGGDGYLWNRRGTVDPEIVRLERLLRGYAHGGGARRASPPVQRVRRARRPRSRWRIAFAAAAVLAVCALGLQAWYHHRLQWEPGRPWQVIARQGEVRLDGERVDGALDAFATGGVLETGRDALVRLRAARIGQVALGEGSRLRLVETRAGRHRLQLLEGRLWAKVWAPPGQFGVGVAGADVLDLGCEFTVDTDAQGRGVLTVRSGWVQVDTGRDEVLVPEGATVRLRDRGALGTPRSLQASAAFVAALDAIDARAGQVEPDGAEIGRLVAASTPGDAISLLSLLQRDPRLAEGPLFDRIPQLLPQAGLVTRADLRTRGPVALGPWWDALPYPRVKRWWMQWPDVLPGGAIGERWLKASGRRG